METLSAKPHPNIRRYRVYDQAALPYFTDQTREARTGALVFVRQGGHGALSLVVVGGDRFRTSTPARELTILVRSSL